MGPMTRLPEPELTLPHCEGADRDVAARARLQQQPREQQRLAVDGAVERAAAVVRFSIGTRATSKQLDQPVLVLHRDGLLERLRGAAKRRSLTAQLRWFGLLLGA
jgi:hypothetical protein